MKHPEQLGKYPITGVIGEGAMGVVYKAFDPIIQRPVAIKTIRKQLINDEDGASFAARFKNEAQAVGRMSHPGIVSIYEYGEEREEFYLRIIGGETQIALRFRPNTRRLSRSKRVFCLS